MKTPYMRLFGLFFLIALTQGLAAQPSVSGNSITWPNDGNYYVQLTLTGEIVCGGFVSCTLPDGRYRVTRFIEGDGTTWDVVVGNPAETILDDSNFERTIGLSGRTLSFSTDGYHQVLDGETYEEICSGVTSCTLSSEEGPVEVINHTLGLRNRIYLFDADSPFIRVSIINSDRVTVSWRPLGFWVQIKYENSGDIACEGVSACSLPAFDMLVSRFYYDGGTTWRIRDGVLIDPTARPVVEGNTIDFQAYDWYQVADTNTGNVVCEGVRSCLVEDGMYQVTRFSDNVQWSIAIGETTQIPVDETNFADTLTVDGRTILWFNNGWHQVQDAQTFEVICGGGGACIVPNDGRYLVINHSLGLRTELEIGQTTTPTQTPIDTDPVTQTGPAVVGNEISWPDNGWYQIENNLTGEIVCQGGLSCTVDEGVYKVIRFFDGGGGVTRVVVGAPEALIVTQDNFAQTLGVTDRTIDWSVDGWYQVQDRRDFSDVCNGETSCTVSAPGLYNVINHSLGLRTVVEIL